MKNPVIALLLAAMVFTGYGTGGNDPSVIVDAPQEKVVIRLSSSQDSNSLPVIGATRVKEIVEEKLGKDRITIGIYPQSQLGMDEDVLELVHEGMLDALIVGNPIVAVESKCSLLELPYLLNNREEVETIAKGKIGKDLNEALLEKGYVNLAYWGSGWRQVTNNVRPIYRPEDLKGLKLRVPAGDSSQELFKNMGAYPTRMAFAEVFTALQQGVLDGQEHTMPVIASQHYYEVQKYLSTTNHIYTMNYCLFSADKWKSYPQDIQEALKQAFQQVADECWAIEEKLAAEAYQSIVGKIEINHVEQEAFIEAASLLYEEPAFINPVGADLLAETLQALGRQ